MCVVLGRYKDIIIGGCFVHPPICKYRHYEVCVFITFHVSDYIIADCLGKLHFHVNNWTNMCQVKYKLSINDGYFISVYLLGYSYVKVSKNNADLYFECII